MTGHLGELTLDAILQVREALDRNEEQDARPLIVTGRQARVLLGMPGRLINKARFEPQPWRGGLIKVVGL